MFLYLERPFFDLLRKVLNFFLGGILNGSGGRDRTYDQLINSQLLYR
jgi:hypothetical protein